MAGLRPIILSCIAAAALAACQRGAPSAASATAPSIVASAKPAVSEDGDDMAALRAAMMLGQIVVAMRLVDEGAGAEAALHFRRPIDEYADMDDKLDTAKFAVAAENASLGKSAKDIRPMAQGLDKQIGALMPRRFSKPVVIKALLDELVSAYRRGVEGPTVTRAQDYQDAYGYARVAADLLADAARENAGGDQARSAQLQREGEALVNLFPSAAAPSNPASPGEVDAQISRIQLMYPGMQ
jgi:hypothetical protein